MNKNDKKFPGIFISFEGIEGAGKSTQIGSVQKYLEGKGFNVLVLREPGGTSFGEALRGAILQSEGPLSPLAEAFLFAAQRAQNLEELIIPHLKNKNHAVLIDRYIDSSLAYQGHARNLGIEFIEGIHTIWPLSLRPDKTFYLQLSVDLSVTRQKERKRKKDYFEKENLEFHKKIKEGFDIISERYQDRVSVVDASREEDEVFKSILKILNQVIQLKDI